MIQFHLYSLHNYFLIKRFYFLKMYILYLLIKEQIYYHFYAVWCSMSSKLNIVFCSVIHQVNLQNKFTWRVTKNYYVIRHINKIKAIFGVKESQWITDKICNIQFIIFEAKIFKSSSFSLYEVFDFLAKIKIFNTEKVLILLYF